VGLHRQITHADALLFEVLAGIEYGLVLGGDSDDVVALFGIHFRHALDSEIVGFGRAARKYDLFGVGADQVRNLLASLLYGLFGLPPETVITAGGVAENVSKVRPHGF